MSVTRLSSLFQHLTSTTFGRRVTMCLSAEDFNSKMFKANISINRHKKLVWGKPCQSKSFCNFSKVRGEDERNMTVLASSRKRADILYQCVANIRVLEYIQIFNDRYIHSSKYSRIFSKWIYSDIHLRLFSPLKYFQTFIRIFRFQQTYSNVFIEQNKTY